MHISTQLSKNEATIQKPCGLLTLQEGRTPICSASDLLPFFGKGSTARTFMLTSLNNTLTTRKDAPLAPKTIPLQTVLSCTLLSTTFFPSPCSYLTFCMFSSYPKEAALQNAKWGVKFDFIVSDHVPSTDNSCQSGCQGPNTYSLLDVLLPCCGLALVGSWAPHSHSLTPIPPKWDGHPHTPPKWDGGKDQKGKHENHGLR